MTKSPIVAFTGHRTYDGAADRHLETTIRDLYAKGARLFRVGMAEGFDLAAGVLLTRLSSELSDITIEACIPWPGFHNRFSSEERLRYNFVLQHSNITRYASDCYHKSVFRHRNNMLVDGADYTVAWWSGSPSGTGYTVQRARSNGSTVINLYPDPQQRLEL